MKSISGLLYVVEDLDKTADFYKSLGFDIKEQTDNYIKVYLNWFWIEFVAKDKVEKTLFQKVSDTEDTANKGAGVFLEISVDNVDEFYEGVVKKGLKPSSEPKDWPWGRREFVIRDPDGYKLVFFSKIKK